MDLCRLMEQIYHAYSGEAAWQMVADISRCHRIQASPGHRQAAHLVAGWLRQAGLSPDILTYPADEQTWFWAWPSFQEWACTDAVLRLVEPAGRAELLADFRSCPISVIQRSTPFEGEAEVIALETGEQEADYDGLDVAGKLVLTRGGVRRVWELAVQKRGALGILFDGMRLVRPVRPEGDLADARQYTSFWWEPGDRHCFGFVLTPRQGQALRQMLREGKGPVRVWARVESRLYDGSIEVVSATIPGQGADEIVVVAHLCHPQPSANDNASGAAAAVEAARVLHQLVAGGQLAPPRRTVRFLWLPEMTGTYAYLAEREAELERLVAGINLDMVGEDQGQTGSSWLIEAPPAAGASFAEELLARLRDEMPAIHGADDTAPSHTGRGAYPLYRQAETPFSGGSDHAILADPSVGVPTPMLIQWPDRFYHTSADTPDRTDPNSLRRAGTLAAAYACWLAAAGSSEIAWLGHEMVARFKGRLVATAQQAVTAAAAAGDGEALAQVLTELDRRVAFQLFVHRIALQTLERLGPAGCLVSDLAEEAMQAANRELGWARRGIALHAAGHGLAKLPERPARVLTEQERQAAGRIPIRQVRGPIPVINHIRRLDEGEREQWRAMVRAREGIPANTLVELALYWADGARSVLDIVDLVELEMGYRDVELLLAHFEMLGKLGLVSFG